MTQPTQGVHIRRIYYASGSPSIVEPVLYDNAYDGQPNVDVLDLVLAYNGQIDVDGYTWNGTIQAPDSSDLGEVLRSMCLAYWKFDSAGGADASGNGHALSLSTGTPTYVTGKVDNAVFLESASLDSLRRLNDATLNLNTNFGFVGWINFSNIDNYQTIFDIIEPNTETSVFQLIWNQFSGFIDLSFAGNGLGKEITPNLNTWYHVAGYLNRSTHYRYLYFNGVLLTPVDGLQSDPYVGNLNLYLGNSFFDDSPSDVRCDEFALFDLGSGELTQAQVDYLYNGGTGRTLYP